MENEFNREFPNNRKISVRKRQKFIEQTNRKIADQFGKDVFCHISFSREGLVTFVSPPMIESTDKGRLFKSFMHEGVSYTSHCVDRFSQRTLTRENCIAALDLYLERALLTYGIHKDYLVCPEGLFAYYPEGDRLIVKTFVNFEKLTDAQIATYYTPDVHSLISDGLVSEGALGSDFIICDEAGVPDDHQTQSS